MLLYFFVLKCATFASSYITVVPWQISSPKSSRTPVAACIFTLFQLKNFNYLAQELEYNQTVDKLRVLVE